MTSLARVLAADSMAPQRLTIYRHLHIADQPIVLVPVTLAGETNAPLAVMVGSDRNRPQIIVTRQPRERAERLVFAERLAGELLFPIQTMAVTTERVGGGPEPRLRATAAPQIWVPNPGGVEFIRLLGRMTRFRRSASEWAAAPSVRQLGIWLTWFAEEAEFADSSVLVATTRALSALWATGQSALEDGNLAALIAWLAPPGMSITEAVRRAEEPATCPPAGPATDPTFDRVFLQPMLKDLATAPTETVRGQVLARLTSLLTSQMQPTWNLMWQAIDLLREVPAASSVGRRWGQQRDRFTTFHHHLTTVGHPQSKRDNAVRGAQRLDEMEQRLATFEAQRAYDDPLVMAGYRLTGDAFAGDVVQVDRFRQVAGDGRARLRPLVGLTTSDPVRLDVGDKVYDPGRNGQEAVIIEFTPAGKEREILLELQDRMGRSNRAPRPGSVPDVGDQVVYTRLRDNHVRRGRQWPVREEIPWTHGGPPPEYVPVAEDAAEDWS
jgi:hypothetical protein